MSKSFPCLLDKGKTVQHIFFKVWKVLLLERNKQIPEVCKGSCTFVWVSQNSNWNRKATKYCDTLCKLKSHYLNSLSLRLCFSNCNAHKNLCVQFKYNNTVDSYGRYGGVGVGKATSHLSPTPQPTWIVGVHSMKKTRNA